MAAERSKPTPVPPSERRRGVTLGPDHTRVPNQLIDLVMPWLSSGEQACLMYIVRRTYGFALQAGAGQRKQWDRIALSQFIDGTSSGGYVLDLGCGLSRPAVIAALARLSERELVRISYECPTKLTKSGRAVGCGWNEGDNDHHQRPKVDPKTNAYSCPRCSRTLSKAYALRALTPGWIKRYLNASDPQKRAWDYDPEVGRFYPENSEPAEKAGREDELLGQIEQLRAELWFPELIDQIIGQAVAQLKSGKMAPSRLMREFLQPALLLQQSFSREAVQYGLGEVIGRKIAAQSRSRNWPGYAKACATGFMERRHGGRQEAQQAVERANVEIDLDRCAELNREGKREEARKLLQELLGSHLDSVKEEFGGDRARARRHLIEAYKRGLSDYAYVRDYTSIHDYLPEWSWERDESSSQQPSGS